MNLLSQQDFWYLSLSTASGYGSVIPDAPGADSHPLTKALGDKVGNYVEQYIEAMEKVTSVQCLLFLFLDYTCPWMTLDLP